MKFSRLFGLVLIGFLLPRLAISQSSDSNGTLKIFGGALMRLTQIVEPSTNEPARTFTTTLKIIKAEGLPKELIGHEFEIAFQGPDHLRLGTKWEKEQYLVGRNGQEVWVDVPDKKFGLLGSPDVALFASAPDRKDATPLGPIKLPVPSQQLMMLPFVTDLEALPDENIDGVPCHQVKATAKPEAVRGFHLPSGTLRMWIRESDFMPMKVAYREGERTDIEIQLIKPQFKEAWAAEKWKLNPGAGEKVESIARSHLTRFLSVALAMMGEKLPTLGPATGERRVLAREGEGRLEMIDGTRVLVLKGTPEEMGHQHGVLMKKQIHELVDRILYGVGVGSSFEKGHWFFGEIESAQARLQPFMDDRYFREMDALADASGLAHEEVRLANFFPELFHCSGFALFGKATEGGHLYHGRILDYLRGLGLEQNAVVMVLQPDKGNAWVNIGYAGFVGSVTAMNEKHLAMGEMGGRGEGKWDGKPMAELVREVMEKANTLEEAVEIMRKGPRTCEYYYVISDAKSRRAVGIAATPDKFETIWPGQNHPLLPHGIADAVLMSAGDRYEELTKRVQANYGHFDATSALELMKRPVCMTSNIHCALFEPETLDFWVANADSEHPAAHTRFTHYNLTDLIQEPRAAATVPAQAAAK